MELKELTEKTIELFAVSSPQELGAVLLDACTDTEKMDAFKALVDNDMTTDWLQKIYQYYLADRTEKKQDYTPSSIAKFMGMLTGESDRIVDMCAGSGALIIQKWCENPNIRFTAIEYDENVIPFLVFNMVIRNIRCRVLHKNALIDDEPINAWDITKGEKYGNIVNIKSTV